MKALIIGAGITGCTCARLLAEADCNILLVEKEDHIGGNCYDYKANELYPILTEENILLHKRKQEKFKLKYKNIFFCGRLATYQYLGMDKAIFQAMNLIKEILK